MSMTPVYAPYLETYAQHQPYVTIDEFVAAPNGINLSELVPNSDANTNRAALAEVLAEASSEADRICHQVLAATSETFVGTVMPQNDGRTLLVAVPNTPIVGVTSYSYGIDSSSLTAVTDSTGIAIESTNLVRLPLLAYPVGGTQYIEVGYIAGYHNSYLQAQVAAATTVLTVDNTLGLVPGMQVSVFDPINGQNEIVTVSALTPTTITLTAGTQFGHPVGVRVSMMPPAIKRAVLLLAQSMIRSKLVQVMQIPSVDGNVQPTMTTSVGAQVKKDYGDAASILSEFARWV